jgi:hypothetical protein
MARSGTYGTKQNKVEDCHQWPMHHKGATGVSKQAVSVYHMKISTCHSLVYHSMISPKVTSVYYIYISPGVSSLYYRRVPPKASPIYYRNKKVTLQYITERCQ